MMFICFCSLIQLLLRRWCQQYLIQYIFVEVGHVAMIRHRSIVIILEVLLQGHRVVWDVQHCVQVVGKHLKK